MARAALTNQTIVTAGIVPSAVAAIADGHSFDNDGDVFFHAINASAGSINVTFQTPAKVSGEEITERVVAVGAGVEKFIGPFNTSVFNQSTGEVYVDYSAHADLTVAAFYL